MNNLNDKQLEKVNGGFNWGIAAVIATIGAFIIGVFNGYTNPKKCN